MGGWDVTLRVVPLTLAQANEAVSKWHRHHKRVVGHRFSIGVVDETGEICGAAIIGRPVARKTPPYSVAEVTRLVTNGKKNACSKLYSSAARICKEMGFQKIQSFILDTEHGTSLKASGWEMESVSAGGDWNTPARGGRRTDQPIQPKHKWKKDLMQ